MADDLDIEALLEAPYQKKEQPETVATSSNETDSNKENQRSQSNKKKRQSRSPSTSRRRDRSDRRSRSRSRHRSSRGRRSRSRSRGGGRRRVRSRSRRRSEERRHRRHSRSRSRNRYDRHRRNSRSKSREIPRTRDRRPSPPPKRRTPPVEDCISAEERDQRTVFCMQLSQRVRTRDLEDFFSAVGKVRDVKLIMDSKTRRSKGIAYIEFCSVNSIPLAIALSSTKLLGVPIIVQPSQAEKNRAAASILSLQKYTTITGPMRLFIANIHICVTEKMLRDIFEPFGRLETVEIPKYENGVSKGYGYVGFYEAEDAKRALEQMNGFELADNEMKISHVNDKSDSGSSQLPSYLDTEEIDKAGVDLGATGRYNLMTKLAQGTDLEVQSNNTAKGGQAQPPITTQCFLLSNMFDISVTQTNPNWVQGLVSHVAQECRKHGGAVHIFIDQASPQGNVYVKCINVAAAVATVNSVHGHYFNGLVINAAYVPSDSYHQLFQDSINATSIL